MANSPDRIELYERLVRLLPGQWSALLIRLGVTQEHLPSELVSPADRAAALVLLLEQSPEGLVRLANDLERFKPQLGNRQSSSVDSQQNYEFDVFVSYWRQQDWPKWIRKTFMPVFEHWMATELGRKPKIAVDYTLETDACWPSASARSLARSKVMVALWSSAYFNSDWCLSELALMRRREDLCGLQPTANHQRLIVPARIHDGNTYPAPALQFAIKDLSRHVGIRVARGSKTAEMLEDCIKEWVQEIVGAIEIAPPIDPAWETLSANPVLEEYRRPPLSPRLPTW